MPSCKLLTSFLPYPIPPEQVEGNKKIEHNYLQEILHKKKKMTKFVFNNPYLPSLPRASQRFTEFPLPNEPVSWEVKPLTPPVAFCLP